MFPHSTEEPSRVRAPTDLEGIIPATYDEKHYRDNPAAALGPACTEIRSAIKDSPSFNRRVTIVSTLQLADPTTSKLTYPKKLRFCVTNSATSPVVVTSDFFQMTGPVKGHPDRWDGPNDNFKLFFFFKQKTAYEIYQRECLLRPDASVTAWLPMDNATDDKVANDALAN